MTATAKRISQDNKEAFRNPWVLGWISAIVLVLSVNVLFISTAFVTSPGLVEKDYYEKGQDHEKNVIKKATAQERTGWMLNPVFPAEILINQTVTYSLNVIDKVGLPLRDAKVTLKAYRPSDASADFQMEMSEVSPGIYQTTAAFSLKGAWELTATVEQGEESLDIIRRIIVRTP